MISRSVLTAAITFICLLQLFFEDALSSPTFAQSTSEQEYRARFQKNLSNLLVFAGLESPEFVDPQTLGYRNADFAWKSSVNGTNIAGLWMNSMDASDNKAGMENLIAVYAELCGGKLTDKFEETLEGNQIRIKTLLLSCDKPGKLLFSSFITLVRDGIATVIMHEGLEFTGINEVNEKFSRVLFSIYEKQKSE